MNSEGDILERWFAIADTNHDGRIEGPDAIGFFQRSGLSRETLREIWSRTAGEVPYMNKQQFYGAIRLVSLAQISGGSFTPQQAQQLLAGISQPPPLPKLIGLSTGGPTAESAFPPMQHTGGSYQEPPRQYTGGSANIGPALQVTGANPVPFQYTGGRVDPSYPPISFEDVNRFGQLFQTLDTDNDGLVQGGQCVQVFSSRGLDKSNLKLIWQAVAGNSGQINRDQFIKCLYLIEIAKQGIPIPSTLPPGNFPPVMQQRSPVAAQGGLPVMPDRAVFQPKEPTPYPGYRGPVGNEGMISTLDPHQRDRLMAEKMEAQKKDQQLYMMDQEAETTRNKKEFFEKALQELTLFKRRMDVASMEVQEKLRREREAAIEAERWYNQIRVGAEEASKEASEFAVSLQAAQNTKIELEAKVEEMQKELSAKERSQPEFIRQLETEIQQLQQSVSSLEQRRNTLSAERESYKYQQDLMRRRQGDLQMAIAAAEAEVHSASADIDKIMSQVEAVKASGQDEQIQKLLREAARVYSNLHSHACKAGIEIPVEARLSLYGDDIQWKDDLIAAGMDIGSWDEDGFVLVDAFPDFKEEMDAEFERALQTAVDNMRIKDPAKVGLGGDFESDPFQSGGKSNDFAAFDASVVQLDKTVQPVETAFAVSFDQPKEPSPGFGTFEEKKESDPFDDPFADFAPNKKDGDPFGDSAFA